MNIELTKTIEDKIKELYEDLMEKPFEILNIFKEFFGEDKVDMQGYWDLERFKSWINIEPISSYISSRNYIAMDSNDWNLYKTWAITDLPENQVNKVLDSITVPVVKDKIGNDKFSKLFILVHFPSVRITNENNRCVDINHLWAKVSIKYDGTLYGSFGLNRSEYTLLHMRSGYLHSHISGIPFHDFTEFNTPCLGSGPIRATISTLNVNYDLNIWEMFCLELSKYVTVESLSGGPYRRLESLGTEGMASENAFTTYLISDYHSAILGSENFKEFVKYFINSKKLKFNYVNGSYSIGMSFVEYIVLISNTFIEWYNDQYNKGKLEFNLQDLKESELLMECVIDKGKIYYTRYESSIERFIQYIGKKVCIFKGEEITISITDIAESDEENKSIILNTRTALSVLATILKVLNFRYGRSKETSERNQFGTKIRYL